MQVKKFEARTMKEALQMVKSQLGPDAIILSARDNHRSFGLVGEGSVEITAAIAEETLRKKQFVESRMREEEKQRLASSSARNQKQFIEKMVTNYVFDRDQQRAPIARKASASTGSAITSRRYIDIDDEHEAHQVEMNGGYTQQPPQIETEPEQAPSKMSTSAQKRIQSAAQRAWTAMQVHGELFTKAPAKPEPVVGSDKNQSANSPVAPVVDSQELHALRGEIATLKSVIAQFKKIPQGMGNAYPGADYGLPYETSHMFEKLVQSEIHPEVAADILNKAKEQMPALRLKNKALVDAWTAKYILDSTQVVGDKSQERIQLFVGPSGSGKTSALIKMASHAAVVEQKKIAVITTDVFKVGAVDQMKIYAQILNVPFAVVRSQADWAALLPKLSHCDAVFVDFPGFRLKDMQENSTLRQLIPPQGISYTSHLVLPSTIKDQDATEVGRRYQAAHFHDVIFSALDESVNHGPIYNFMHRFKVPLHSFGIGPRVPEDFEFATKERVLDLVFKLSKVKKG